MIDSDFTGFYTPAQTLPSEKQERTKEAKGKLAFGVDFLDAAAAGIAKGDLVLIGGRSGEGKSELAVHIALANVRNKKRVYIIALEAELKEVERRMKFKMLSDAFFKSGMHHRTDERPNYAAWYDDEQNDLFEKFEKQVDETIMGFSTLHIKYRTKDYTLENLERDIASIKDDADLVVIDHLHYFDHSETNENKAFTNIIKKMRDLVLVNRLPFVCVAHVRKGDRFSSIVPEQEDFHGASEIFKTPTKVITIAKDYSTEGREHLNPSETSTFMRVCKFRRDGGRIRFVGLTIFDSHTNSYGPFKIGTLSPDGKTWNETLPNKRPFWSKRGLKLVETPTSPESIANKIIPPLPLKNCAPTFPYKDN